MSRGRPFGPIHIPYGFIASSPYEFLAIPIPFEFPAIPIPYRFLVIPISPGPLANRIPNGSVTGFIFLCFPC